MREFISHTPLVAFPMMALALFVAVFAGIVVRTFRGDRKVDATVASLPLFDAGGTPASTDTAKHTALNNDNERSPS